MRSLELYQERPKKGNMGFNDYHCAHEAADSLSHGKYKVSLRCSPNEEHHHLDQGLHSSSVMQPGCNESALEASSDRRRTSRSERKVPSFGDRSFLNEEGGYELPEEDYFYERESGITRREIEILKAHFMKADDKTLEPPPKPLKLRVMLKQKNSDTLPTYSHEPLPRYEALHQNADTKKRLNERAKEFFDLMQVFKHTFQPQFVSRRSEAVEKASFYERGERAAQKKIEFIEEMIRKLEESAKVLHTFHPKISSKSEKLIQSVKEKDSLECLPVSLRLFEKGRRNLRKREIEELERNAPPTLSTAESHKKKAEIQSFLKRLDLYKVRHLRRQQAVLAEAASNETFQPDLSESAVKFYSSNPQVLYETPQERLQRLAVKDVQRRRAAHQKLLKQSEYPFHPFLSNKSRALAAKRLIRMKKLAEERSDCRFGEKTNEEENKDSRKEEPEIIKHEKLFPRKKFPNTKSMYSDPSQIIQQIRREQTLKERQLEASREKNEAMKLSGCTFHPVLVSKPAESIPSNPKLPIKGLDRFFELKVLAKKQHDEQESREAKVFLKNSHQANDWRDTTKELTIPIPFDLSRPIRSCTK